MRSIAIVAGLAIAVASLPTASPAACQKRANGAIIGAVTGGLLGHAIAGRGGHAAGALLGAGAGGLVGNQVSKCDNNRRAAYRPSAPHRASYDRPQYASAATCRYTTQAFYDPYGRVSSQPTRVCAR